MSDIIKKYQVRLSAKEKPKLLRFYFETASPSTFLKQLISGQLQTDAKFPEPKVFNGLGNGNFKVTHMVSL